MKYIRILEILDDYWGSEPDEAWVRIDMKFLKDNGEQQEKRIIWANPYMNPEKLWKMIPERWKDES